MPDATPQRRLLTREQVVSALRAERERDGLTATARRYGLQVQQLCDLLADPPRTKLSSRMVEKLALIVHTFYERKEQP